MRHVVNDLIVVYRVLCVRYYPLFYNPTLGSTVMLGSSGATRQAVWVYCDNDAIEWLPTHFNQSIDDEHMINLNKWKNHTVSHTWYSYIHYRSQRVYPRRAQSGEVFEAGLWWQRTPILPAMSVAIVHHMHNLLPCHVYEYKGMRTSPHISALVVECVELMNCAACGCVCVVYLSLTNSYYPLLTVPHHNSTFQTAPSAWQSHCTDLHNITDTATPSSPSSSVARTPAAVAASPAVHFIFGSCLGTSVFSDIRAFTYLLQQPQYPHFVLLLGDTVYTDIPRIDDHLAYRSDHHTMQHAGGFAAYSFLVHSHARYASCVCRAVKSGLIVPSRICFVTSPSMACMMIMKFSMIGTPPQMN